MEISDKAHSLRKFLAADYGNGRFFYNGCLKFARRLMQNPDDAEDLVGNAYLRVMRVGGMDRYEHPIPAAPGRTEESGRIRNYLYTIIKNLALDIIKTGGRRVREFPLLDNIVTRDNRGTREQNYPEEIAIQEETKRIIRESLLNLPAMNREIVFMYYFLGLNLPQLTPIHLGYTIDLFLQNLSSVQFFFDIVPDK